MNQQQILQKLNEPVQAPVSLERELFTEDYYERRGRAMDFASVNLSLKKKPILVTGISDMEVEINNINYPGPTIINCNEVNLNFRFLALAFYFDMVPVFIIEDFSLGSRELQSPGTEGFCHYVLDQPQTELRAYWNGEGEEGIE